jgi:spore coat polysaccharide biosynthesis protein SpsF
MSSSRLPGKVLKDIAGQPMLGWVVERVRLAHSVDEVVVATTQDQADDPIAAFCAQRGYPCFRGDQFDVLDRYYQAATAFGAQFIVRVTADCPLIDPEIVDRVVSVLIDTGVDFVADRLPPPWKRTYPIGLDVEACTYAALERAWREAALPHEREHVMPYLYDEPGHFQTLLLQAHADYGDLRWTVDTPEDLEAVRLIFSFFQGRKDVGWLEVLELMDYHPELRQLNVDVRPKAYDDVDQRFDQGRFDPPTPDELLDHEPPEPDQKT